MFDPVTFLLLNDRIFLIIVHLAKIVSSPFRLLVQNKHLIIIVVSLIAMYTTRTVRSVTLRMIGINDLCRSFRYLISWWYARWKFMYRVYDLSLLYTLVIMLNSIWMIFIDTSDSCYCCSSSMRFDENPKSDLILWGFNEIHSISVFDFILVLLLAWIVNEYWWSSLFSFSYIIRMKL